MDTAAPKPTQDRLREAAHGVVDKAIDATGPATKWLDEKKNFVSEEHQQLAGYVSSNPVKALAVVFVAGLLLGRIL